MYTKISVSEFYEKYWRVEGKEPPPLSESEKTIWDIAEKLECAPYVKVWKRVYGWVYILNPLVAEEMELGYYRKNERKQYSRLSKEQVLEIRELRATGLSAPKIQKALGDRWVAINVIEGIIYGNTYKLIGNYIRVGTRKLINTKIC